MVRNTITLAFLALMFPLAHADSWSFPKERKDTVYEYGKTKIVRTIDATKDQKHPDFILQIFENNELLAMYRNVSFEILIPNAKKSAFVGISNSGIPGTAVVIFGAKGDLWLEIKHELGHFEYCEESVTLIRKWFDAENIDVHVEDKDITFRGCGGNRLSLEKVVKQAYNHSLQARRP